MLPELIIDLNKIKMNIDRITPLIKKSGCSIMFVTKGMCGDRRIAEIAAGNPDIGYLADSRISNIRKYEDIAEKYGKKTVLLRLPGKSHIDDTVMHADISLNSDIDTIRLLNDSAKEHNVVHGILLMIDLGDLREGIFFRDEEKIKNTVREILQMKNIHLAGIGTNLTCYGGVVPTEENLGILCSVAGMIEEESGIGPDIVSGGNSSSLYLAYEDRLPERINNLRIGGRYYHGCPKDETRMMEGAFDDAITLKAEIIEIFDKPSVPVGESGTDAFGRRPEFEDRGIIKRAILAIGEQDIDPASLVPEDSGVDILGASSDHLILDISKSSREYHTGDAVSFKLHYLSMMRAATSEYVDKVYIGSDE